MEVGIDFGTTYSTLCFSPGRGVAGCVPESGSIYIPTVVGFRSDGTYAIGLGALLEKDLTIYRDIKRYFGLNKYNAEKYFSKLKPTIEVVVGTWGCAIGPTDGSRGKTKNVIELASMFVKGLVNIAVRLTNLQVTVSVCSVPADYNSYMRGFIYEACKLADISVQAVVNEPTAAGLSAFVEIPKNSVKYMLVYDFGGGTFDSSLMVVGPSYVCVIDSRGDNYLGGRDVDNKLAEVAALKLSKPLSDFDQFSMEALKIDVVSNPKRETHRLLLKNGEIATINLKYAEFKAICEPFVKRAKTIVEDLLIKNEVRDCVAVLIGGSSILPGVKNSMSSLPQITRVVFSEKSYRAAVAIGAGVYAQTFAGTTRYRLIDSVSSTLSDEKLPLKAVAVFPKGHPIPATVEQDLVMPSYDTGVVLHEGESSFINMIPRTYSASITSKDLQYGQTGKQTFKISEDGRLEVFLDGKLLTNTVRPEIPRKETVNFNFESSDERRMGPEVLGIKSFYARHLSEDKLIAAGTTRLQREVIYEKHGIKGHDGLHEGG